ncbi:MAG: FtsH protease activity modulator HflK [Anaerolineales bacterium]|nr:FtsH protease activity modulator HflK [Anaerolineales bacterium]
MRRTNIPRSPSPSEFFDPEWMSKNLPRILKLAGIGILVIWVLSGFYMVGPGERGLVLTFGRLTSQTDPGLHYRLPIPMQSHVIVDIAQVRSTEIGYRTDESQAVRPILQEAQMLTGDENIVEMQLFVQYLVQDPVKFMFHVRAAEEVLTTSAEIALRSTVGQNTIDFTMTEGRVEAQNQVKTLLQELLDDYETGLLVTEARLLAVDPPADVRDAFHDVVRAFEDRERLVQEAEGYAERVVPAARGLAAQMILEAEAYREQRVIRAEGDAARFIALLDEYSLNPDVMRERLYLESIEEVLHGSSVFVLDTTQSGILPFLPLTQQNQTVTLDPIQPDQPVQPTQPVQPLPTPTPMIEQPDEQP